MSGVALRSLRSFWTEPRPVSVPRGRRDQLLLGVLFGVALLEVILRDDLALTTPSVLLGLALMPSVLWRRSHPLLMTALAFGATGASELLGMLTGQEGAELNAVAFLLILPYALFRWGSGREALLGLPIILAAAGLGLARDDLPVGEVLGGLAILMAPVALGTATRYREAARAQELEDVRTNERLDLARELHDTVAHHVSAIAVRAQAGLATASQDPEAALQALQVIGEEASRTLGEMRAMVRVLRDDEPARLAPAARISDLAALAEGAQGRERVSVDLIGETDRLSPSLSSALYRLAQESITNARRHARAATLIAVTVTVAERAVTLRVQDDGEPTTAGGGGFGLLGMAERAQLFGGTLRAGPGPGRGWVVTADLPLSDEDSTP